MLVTGGLAAAFRDAAIAAGANDAVPKQLVPPAKLLQIIEHGMLPGDPRELDPMTRERAKQEQVAAAYLRNGRSPTRTLRAPTPRR